MSTFQGRTYGVRGTRRRNAGRVHDADLLRAAEDILVQARDLSARWNALGLQTRTAKNYRDALAWVLQEGQKLRTWAMTSTEPADLGHIYVPSGMARVMRAELRKAARWIGQQEVIQAGDTLRENPRPFEHTAVAWESDVIPGPYTHDYMVWVEQDVDVDADSYRVVTVSRQRDAVLPGRWYYQDASGEYPGRRIAIAAAKERVADLQRKHRRPNFDVARDQLEGRWAPRRENPGGGKWYVYVDGHHEQTAFFDPEMTKEEVVRALVDEGYDEKTLKVRQSYRDRITDPRRNPSRRANPALAILNPLPAHLEEFARTQRLTADERREFNEAIARYCEFHDVEADDVSIEPWGEVEGDGTRFLVGLGKAEDVSYSVNTKGKFTGSNKKGIPFRHKIEARDTVLASTPDGEMTIILNKPGAAKRMVVRDWLRG